MQPKSPPNPIRRQLLTSITSLLGFVGVIFAAIPFLSAFRPSARAEAAGAPVKVNISKLSPGELMTVEWRGCLYLFTRSQVKLKTLYPQINPN